MPATSQAQRRWAYWADAHPEESGVSHKVAKEFQAGPKGLPETHHKKRAYGGLVRAEESNMKYKADHAGAPNGQGTVSDPGIPAKIDIPGRQVMEESKKGSAGFKRGGAIKKQGGGGLPAQASSRAGTALANRPALPSQAQGTRPFKKGGKVQTADGNCPPGRMDKKRRGGRVTMRGRSPMSAAASLSGVSGGRTH